MGLPDRFRSLATQSALGIILPIVLVTFGLIAGGLYTYQQMTMSLVIDRDRQIATLIAANVTGTIDGYAGVLEALASNADLQSPAPSFRENALADASKALKIFNAGVVLLDKEGKVATVAPSDAGTSIGPKILSPDYVASIREQQHTVVSHVLTDPRNDESMIVIGTPVLDQKKSFIGVLAGGIYLQNSDLGLAVEHLTIGEQGFAYIVGPEGRVLFHPDKSKVGTDYSDRPFVDRVIVGQSGGTLWGGTRGEQMVEGYAPIPNADWGLIVVEPWDVVVAPVQTYSTTLTLMGVFAIAIIAFLLWYGVGRITNPVHRLAEETNRLAAGDAVHPVALGGILELDLLGTAFNRMAAQIASYRSGLRRYLGAMTKSQEDERRHLARELHDETTQSLLAITRRLELIQACENDPQRLGQLQELQGMLTETLGGVRQISRDLRPLILEDLGLVPALEVLARTTRENNGKDLQVHLEVKGQASPLSAEEELSLYRITQEALANVRKHAHAHQANVSLTFERKTLHLVVKDDGSGFELPPALSELAQHDHFGLMGIQERVWAVGGSLFLQSVPGQGTEVAVTIPLHNGQVKHRSS